MKIPQEVTDIINKLDANDQGALITNEIDFFKDYHYYLNTFE